MTTEIRTGQRNCDSISDCQTVAVSTDVG